MSGDDVSLIRWGSTPSCRSMDRTASDNPPRTRRGSSAARTAPDGMRPFAIRHVQLIGWGIDGATHQAMATRNGHEVVDPSQIPK